MKQKAHKTEGLQHARKKPDFVRRDWHKKIKLGKTVKKKRKWRASKGRHGKIRLNRKGYSLKPKIGWGNKNDEKGLVEGVRVERIESLNQIEKTKSKAIIVGRIGRKKRMEILKIAKEKGIKILNKYKQKNEPKQ
jgi:large subunit ribosomal protein L32e